MSNLIKIGYTEYLPGVLARPAQPYIPPTPAWTEYRRVEACSTEPPTGTWTTVVTPNLHLTVNEDGIERWVTEYVVSFAETTVPGKRTCSFSTVPVYHPASPGQPYLPAVNAQPPRVDQNKRLGWNSGAVSIASLDASGGYTFKINPGSIGVVAGFTDHANPTHPSQITHGLYASRSTVQAIESGSVVGLSSALSDGDILAVQRKLDGGVVYLINGTEIHSSANESVGLVSFGAAMYSAGDGVNDAQLESVLTPSASSSNMLAWMYGSASDYGTAYANDSMLPLQAGGGNYAYGRMGAMGGMSSDAAHTSSTGAMEAMGGSAYGDSVAPSFCGAEHYFFPMQGFSTGIEVVPTVSSGVMHPAIGLSSDGVYGEASGSVAPLNGFASGRNMHNVMDAAIIAGSRSAYGTMSPSVLNGGALSSPSRTASGWFGGHAKLMAIKRSVSGSASSIGVMRGALVATARTVSGTGRVSFVARSTDLVAKPGVVSGGFGASGSIAAHPRSISGRAISGGVGRGSLRMRAPSVAGSATEQSWGYGALVAKAGYITQGGRAELLRPQSVVSGWLSTQKTVGNAYSVVLDRGQDAVASVTRYTSYPFVGMARFNGKNYGASADGLYDLDADTDDGQAIAWSFTMSAGDFNKHVKKNIASTHFSGALGAGQAQFSVKSDVDATYTYTPDAACVGKPKNHRVKFGRGNSDRFAAVGVSGSTRSSFNTIGFEILESKRRI